MASLINSAVVKAAKKLRYTSVKLEQLQIVTSVVRVCDVFCFANWIWEKPLFCVAG